MIAESPIRFAAAPVWRIAGIFVYHSAMKRTLRRPIVHRSTATILLAISTVSAAEAGAFKARTPDGDLVLVDAAGQESYVARSGGGDRVRLPLSPSSLVHSFGAAGEGWYAAAVELAGGGRRLVVLTGAGAAATELPAPTVTDAAELAEPSLLIDAGGLKGLAWIEGRAPRLQVVKVAAWTAGGWREPATVSPRGPGSQMALATAALGGGSFLLAWAAFDGQDDEILWSRWTAAAGPSPPARLGADNAVPDITPHVWPTPDGGAFAAWSRYDGRDYRVNLARFDGESWSEPEVVGPKGSVYPTFYGGPDGALLVYRQAVPSAWNVAELDGKGKVLRETGFETAESEPPLVWEAAGGEVSLGWIDGSGALSKTSGLAWRAVR